MRAWLASLSPRERLVTVGGLGALACLLLWALVWEPFRADYLSLRESVAAKRELVAWMAEAGARIRALGTETARAPTPLDDQSLLALVDQTSKQAGLGPAIKRIEPEGRGRVRLWLEDASFDVAVGWLAGLAEEHGVRAERAAFDRQQDPGKVNARLTLDRPGNTGAGGAPP